MWPEADTLSDDESLGRGREEEELEVAEEDESFFWLL